jgi:hypothetical protein
MNWAGSCGAMAPAICRVHVRGDSPGGKYDVTFELNGPGVGALRADVF